MSERMALLRKLAGAGIEGFAPAALFVDKVDARGRRIGLQPAPLYRVMSLDALRGLVASKLSCEHK